MRESEREREKRWTVVGGRSNSSSLRRRRWDHAGNVKDSVPSNRVTTTFFLTSFLDYVKARELYESFREFGDVDEVIIPGRRDKYGKRFGFVRFFEVAEAERLAVKLDNIHFGEQKLFVNIPRFLRGNKKLLGGKGGKEVKELRYPTVGQVGYGAINPVGGDSSYAAVVKNGHYKKPVGYQGLSFDFDASVALQRFSKAFVGRVFEVGMTYNLQVLFDREGLFGIKATALGANLCLLEDREEGAVQRLIDSDSEWINSEIRNV